MAFPQYFKFVSRPLSRMNTQDCRVVTVLRVMAASTYQDRCSGSLYIALTASTTIGSPAGAHVHTSPSHW